MSNRSTVKSNIIDTNVPTVTNDILTEMLNEQLADNVVFKEDVAVSQSSSASNITLDFSGKDRIDLTRTGGSLNISISNLGDGEEKCILITKTAGQEITFSSVTDVTPSSVDVASLSLVLYKILRKGSNYFAYAIAKSTDSESLTFSGTEDDGIDSPVLNGTKSGKVISVTVSCSNTEWGLDTFLYLTTIANYVSPGYIVNFSFGAIKNSGTRSINGRGQILTSGDIELAFGEDNLDWEFTITTVMGNE